MSGVDGTRLLVNLLVCVGAVALTMGITMAYSMRVNRYSIVDTVWGLGFVVIAAVSYGLSAGHGDATRRTVVLVLTAVWGVRLAAHIHLRNHGHEDPRYATLMRHRTGPLVPFLVRRIHGMQGAFMWLVSLPVQVAMYETGPAGVVTWVGVGIWATGFLFEAVGDWQLRGFIRDPANSGKIMDRGLWAWTRHPNYFGDTLLWWGLWVIGLSSWIGVVAVVGPLAMTDLLLNRSGKALLERRMARKRGAAYEAYLARTSGFIPRPPRRRAAPPPPSGG